MIGDLLQALKSRFRFRLLARFDEEKDTANRFVKLSMRFF